MGVASGCGEQEVGVASGSGWNLWVWLLGVVVRRYIDFLILLIPTSFVSVIFYSSIPTFCSFKKMFFVLVPVLFKITFYVLNNFLALYQASQLSRFDRETHDFEVSLSVSRPGANI